MTLSELLIAGGAIIVAITLVLYFRRLTIDTLRLDALQNNQWRVACLDGKFGVIGGSPPHMIGTDGDDLRAVIDGAMKEVHRG